MSLERDICPGCLLRDMPRERPLSRIIRECHEALPDDQRAAAGIYEQRLLCCKTCGELTNGLCRLCGCYVEARAVKNWQRCPRVPPRWESS